MFEPLTPGELLLQPHQDVHRPRIDAGVRRQPQRDIVPEVDQVEQLSQVALTLGRISYTPVTHGRTRSAVISKRRAS